MRNRRRNRTFRYAYGALTAAWFAYLIYLDFAYQKFPAVLVGGLKIYLAVSAPIVLLVIVRAALGRLRLRRARIAE